MRDVLGYRMKFGVLGPSTNTIVQPDFEMMRPPGVTNHYSRIFTPERQGHQQRVRLWRAPPSSATTRSTRCAA